MGTSNWQRVRDRSSRVSQMSVLDFLRHRLQSRGADAVGLRARGCVRIRCVLAASCDRARQPSARAPAPWSAPPAQVAAIRSTTEQGARRCIRWKCCDACWGEGGASCGRVSPSRLSRRRPALRLAASGPWPTRAGLRYARIHWTISRSCKLLIAITTFDGLMVT